MNNFFRKDHKKLLLVLFMFLACFCLYANGNGSGRELDLPLIYAIAFFMGIAFFFQGWVVSGIIITVGSFLLYAAETNPSIFSDAARELLH